MEALLKSGLIRILWATEAATGLLHAGLEASLVGILAGLNAAILGKPLLETGLERILAHLALAHTGEAAPHHLLHLGQLLLHLHQLLLHLTHLAHLAELAGETLARKALTALLLHGEVVELLSVVAATLLLLAEKFAE